MKSKITHDQKKEIISFYNGTFSRLVKSSGIKSYVQLLSLWMEFRKIHLDAADSVLQKHEENFDHSNSRIMEKIEARSVIIEVVDRKTGKLFRRELPINYLETDNGIIISGENSDGNPSDITFLSDTAVKRINDLTGRGPDTPRCGH